jgi:hypothetical protein
MIYNKGDWVIVKQDDGILTDAIITKVIGNLFLCEWCDIHGICHEGLYRVKNILRKLIK